MSTYNIDVIMEGIDAIGKRIAALKMELAVLQTVIEVLMKENAELRKALSAADTYAVCLEEELENLRLRNVSK